MPIGSKETPQLTLSYEQVGRRIQRIVADPKVQKRQVVTVSKREDEPMDAWNRVLVELEETDGVNVERHPDGSAVIAWKQFIDS